MLGLAVDAIYHLSVLRTSYPIEALIVAFLLAVAPYLVIRGVVVRVLDRRASVAPQTYPGLTIRNHAHDIQ